MVYLKFNEKLIINEMCIPKLLRKRQFKDINTHKDIVMGLLVIEHFLCQDWFISGITMDYLKNNLKRYLPLLNPAIEFIEKNAKPDKRMLRFIKRHRIRFYEN